MRAEEGTSPIEPLGLLRIAGTRHTTYKYVYLCHKSTAFSCFLNPLPIPHTPLKLEVIFCVQTAISPRLANLFLHYAFDRWMAKPYPQVRLERYADEAIVHGRTEAEAQEVGEAIAARLREGGLELHPEKTKLVYGKEDDRRRAYPNEEFDFLGYTFRPRRSKNRLGKYFIHCSPAVSDKGGEGDSGGDWKLEPALTQRPV